MNKPTLTAAQAEALDEMRDLHAYAVANRADAASDNAAAADFWEGIRDAVIEAIEYANGDEPDDTTMHEIADGAPDIYNHGRMLQLVGTRCYLDTPEFAGGGEDILTLAGYVLYAAANLAARELVREYLERVEELSE